MKKVITVMVASLFMVSCASNSGSNNRAKNIQVSHNAKVVLADKSSEEKVICRQVKRTGSNRITTVCQSASEIEATRKQTQSELNRSIGRGGPKKVGSKGF